VSESATSSLVVLLRFQFGSCLPSGATSWKTFLGTTQKPISGEQVQNGKTAKRQTVLSAQVKYIYLCKFSRSRPLK